MRKLVALLVLFVALFAGPTPARSAVVAFFSSLEIGTGMNLKFKTQPPLT